MDGAEDGTPDTLGALRAVAGMAAEPPPVSLAPGELIDAYRIEARIGAGGMGVVYRARDERLHRDVAIKLHARSGDAVATARLRREATAMAQLSHPNVVTIYEVGEHEGQVFLAMEYLAGGTARAWQAARPRLWREVLAVYLAAGRGLAAAHAAGLVHRDFKPDNVLLGADGRVRVGDFGLARAHGEPRGGDGDSPGDAGATMTATGLVAGTPAYMAPEQLDGDSGPAADQFAFAVALWEALHGERPFAGATAAELAGAARAGRVREPPMGRSAPVRVRRALARALAADPSARFPSMNALLAALEPPTRRGLAAGAFAAIAIGAGAAVAVPRWLAAPADACSAGPREIARAWGTDRAERVRAGLGATGGFGGAAASRIVPSFDTWARRWAVQYRAVCGNDAWSAELRDRGLACLARRRGELETIADLLSVADAATAAHADEIADGLSPPEPCADAAYLAASAPPPSPTIAAASAPLEHALARADAWLRAGHDDAGLALDQALDPAASALGDASLVARVDVSLGTALGAHGRYGDAAFELERAYVTARDGADAETAARAASAAAVALLDVSRDREAEEWARLGEIEARRTSWPGLQAQGLGARARISQARGDLPRALDLIRRELALLGPDEGADVRADALAARADVEAAMGASARAVDDLREAIRVVDTAFGTGNPYAAGYESTLGTQLAAVGRLDEAIALERDALAETEARFGGDSAEVGGDLLELGGTLYRANRYADALAVLDRALAIHLARFGDDAYDTASVRNNRALALTALGRFDEAIAEWRHAIPVWTALLGADHTDVAIAYGNLADAEYRAGRLADAAADADRAVAIWQRAAADNPLSAYALTTRGAVRAARGDRAAARADLERALALRTAADADPIQRAYTQALLARAIAAADPARARALADAARAGYRAAGISPQPDVAAYLAR